MTSELWTKSERELGLKTVKGPFMFYVSINSRIGVVNIVELMTWK